MGLKYNLEGHHVKSSLYEEWLLVVTITYQAMKFDLLFVFLSIYYNKCWNN